MYLGLRLALGLLLLLWGLSLWGTAVSARRLQEREEARSLVTEALSGRTPERETELFRRARGFDPVYAACEEGAQLEARGLFAESTESFRRCREGDPGLLAAHVAWGETLLRARGQPAYQEVQTHLRRVLNEAQHSHPIGSEDLQRIEDLLLDIGDLLVEDSPAGLPERWKVEDLLEILTRPDSRGDSRYDGPRAALRFGFRPGDTYLGDAAKEELRRVALTLKHGLLADALIQIEGHTDSREIETERGRRSLARQRAEAVRNFLVHDLGVSPKRLRIAAFGDNNPLASNETVEGRDKNRRVELLNLETKEPLLQDARRAKPTR